MLAEVVKSVGDGEPYGVPESLLISREEVSCLDSILGKKLSQVMFGGSQMAGLQKDSLTLASMFIIQGR